MGMTESGSQWKDGLCCDFTKNEYKTISSVSESLTEPAIRERGWELGS